ncbi:unnamed protein product [Leuciscus chuanchicus]
MTRFDYCCRTDLCADWNKGAHLAGNLLVLWIRAADGGDGRRLILEYRTCSLGGGTPAGSAGVDSEEQALIKPLPQDSENCSLHPRRHSSQSCHPSDPNPSFPSPPPSPTGVRVNPVLMEVTDQLGDNHTRSRTNITKSTLKASC